MAVIWENCAICRIFSLHKNCEASDVERKGAKQMTTFTFDFFGQYIFTADNEKVQAYYYKDFATPIAEIDSKGVEALACDSECSQIYAIHNKSVELLTRAETK